MVAEFLRFPDTPHLAWLGEGQPRADKVFSQSEAQELLSHALVVEEKVDGANLGFSRAECGELLAQNRGSYLDLDHPAGQWKPLRRWLSPRREALVRALGCERILFGEWCYAVHSVHYTRLPDWFLAFDVYDHSLGAFWSSDRRDALATSLGLHTPPALARGRVTLEDLLRLLERSALRDGPAEGVYLRREQEGRLLCGAKLVRAQFVQAIEEHWSRRKLEPNQLASEKRN